LSELRLVKALSRDPHLNAFVHNAIGNIYAGEKQYEEALSEFALSVEADPSFYIGILTWAQSISICEGTESPLKLLKKLRQPYLVTGRFAIALAEPTPLQVSL